MRTTDFAALMADLMAGAGVSAFEVANRTGMTHQAVLNLAAGKVAGPRTTTVEVILQEFGKSWAYLDKFQVKAKGKKGRKRRTPTNTSNNQTEPNSQN